MFRNILKFYQDCVVAKKKVAAFPKIGAMEPNVFFHKL